MAEKRDNKSSVAPPKWANRFLEWYCAAELLDEVQGDLHEAFYFRVKRYGLQKAKWLFVKEVLLFCRPSSFKKNTSLHYVTNPDMFQNYLKIAFRNLLKSKVFSAINVFGLALGLAACFLIMQYVLFELSYDQFHEGSDRIYRVSLEGNRTHSAANHPLVGPALKEDFPEVEAYIRMVHQSIIFGENVAISYDDGQGNVKMFNEDRLYDVDSSFFSMFNFPFLYGDPENALSEASSIVISETISNKFFGSENPLGKRLLIFGRFPFTVSGVFKDVPENSHIKFNVLIATWMRHREGMQAWPEFYTYIKLDSLADPEQLAAKFPDFMQKYLGDRMREMNNIERLHLQPITDIHLRSPKLTKEREAHGNEQTVYFLTLIAVLILVIAWINYINLSTSKSIERAQEIGLRKVAGASRRQLITQFLFESAIVNFIAIVLSFIIIIVSAPHFYQLAGKNIEISIVDLMSKPQFWLTLAGVFLFGSCCAGLYPALILSSFRVTTALKGKFFRSSSGIVLRKTLVSFQFVISVALIAGTIMVLRQVSFMQNQELGYEKDQLLVIKTPLVVDSLFHQRLKTFKIESTRNPNIYHVAPSNEIPGKLISQVNFIRNKGEGTEANTGVFHFHIGSDFMSTYGLTIIAGRNFKENEDLSAFDDLTTQPVPVMLNEKAVTSLGYRNAEAATNQLINFGLGARDDWVGEIVGIVSNYHQRFLKEEYDPILYFPVKNPTPHLSGQYVTVNLNTNQLTETIAFIEEQYAEVFPGNAFEYFFLDDYFDHQYAADQQFGRVFGLFSALALIVACLGLFGLSTFMISQRVKEIAVRKVLGATISSMAVLFSKDFVRLILLANLIALPLVYLGVQRWLSNFAFQVHIGWLIFVVPAAILLVISLSTVSFQTLKTGSGNPIDHLRQE
ncbi:MAG: ABC transporter permease [Bacteroidota bacterium]